MEIDIVLATCNGERYIGQQINSILNQTYRDWNLIIRDDGSKDNTVNIINRYVQTYPDKIRLIVNASSNIGASQNFNSLLQQSSAPYIFCCDQDDVWLSQKIELTFQRMQALEDEFGYDCPLLVHADLQVVDQVLKLVSNSFWNYHHLDPNAGDQLNRILIRNVITGCTMLINKALRNLVLPIPVEAVMYDWWVGLVAAALGQVSYLDAPMILYRQHDFNAVGTKGWNASYIWSKISKLDTVKSYYRRTVTQSQCFLERYRSILGKNNLDLVEAYACIDQINFYEKRAMLFKYQILDVGLLRNIALLSLI